MTADLGAQWRPIDTAPRDGTKILICASWAHPEMKHMTGRVAVDSWHVGKIHGYDGWGNFNHAYYPASHWIPLPPPPSPTTPPDPATGLDEGRSN